MSELHAPGRCLTHAQSRKLPAGAATYAENDRRLSNRDAQNGFEEIRRQRKVQKKEAKLQRRARALAREQAQIGMEFNQRWARSGGNQSGHRFYRDREPAPPLRDVAGLIATHEANAGAPIAFIEQTGC